MIDEIANGFLFLTCENFIIPIIVLGYIWADRNKFFHATCLILISMIFNTALKVTFEIPLSPVLGKAGFAFPSGHMQSATTFFGYLAYRINSIVVRILIIAILIGIGISLIHFKYHNCYDVLAAVFFSFLLMFAYNYINKAQLTKRKISWIIIFISTILVAYIWFKTRQISSHIWMSYYALIGFIVAERISPQINVLASWGQKTARTIICLCMVFVVIFIFSNKAIVSLPLFISNLHWLIVGFVLPATSRLTSISKRFFA